MGADRLLTFSISREEQIADWIFCSGRLTEGRDIQCMTLVGYAD